MNKNEDHIKSVVDKYAEKVKETEKLVHSGDDVITLVMLGIVIICGIVEFLFVYFRNVVGVMVAMGGGIICALILSCIVHKSSASVTKLYKENYKKRKKAMKSVLDKYKCCSSKDIIISKYGDLLSASNQAMSNARTWLQIVAGLDSAGFCVLLDKTLSDPNSYEAVDFLLAFFSLLSALLIVAIKAVEIYHERFSMRYSFAIQVLRNMQIEEREKAGRANN